MKKELIKDKYHDAVRRPRNTDARDKKRGDNVSEMVIETFDAKNDANVIVPAGAQEIRRRWPEKVMNGSAWVRTMMPLNNLSQNGSPMPKYPRMTNQFNMEFDRYSFNDPRASSRLRAGHERKIIEHEWRILGERKEAM